MHRTGTQIAIDDNTPGPDVSFSPLELERELKPVSWEFPEVM